MGSGGRHLPYRKGTVREVPGHIGQRIKQLRLERGYSLTELAAKAGVAKSYLSNIERQVQSNPSMLFLQKIGKVFGIEVELLVTGAEPQALMLDPEWTELAKQAAESGVTKEEFRSFIDYVKFQQWSRKKDSQA